MKTLVLSIAALVAAGGAGLAQETPPAPAGAAVATVSYEDALSCAMNYQLHAGEAEMQGLKDVRKGRMASSDKAVSQAAALGEKAGKSARTVEDELSARMDRVIAKPPSRAALTTAARRCDSLMALTTP